MRSLLSSVASLAVLFAVAKPALAAVPVWGQCGGNGWSGETTCASGSTCVVVNEWYHQCQPGAGPTTTSSAPNPTSSGCPNATKFRFFGVNQAGAEFGENVIPGELGTHYTWPSPSSIDYFVNQGFNTFRVAFKIERLSPPGTGLTGPFDQAYLNGLKTIVNYITGKNAYAVLDPHNYMRYNGNVITSTSNFQTWWNKLATEFRSNTRVIFDVMNEPYQIDASVVFNLNQAAINGIRASGATSQLILVEGTAWTGAWSWESSGNGAVFGAIRDPNNNTAIEMHQYLDSDSSGTSATCVSSTVGVERLRVATDWLRRNNLKGFLGEMGAGSNDVCIAAVKGALCAMQQSGVWIGYLWWAAGPWWGTYFQSIEPPNGASIARILPEALKPFV
ncbi:hypothetical protein AX16_002671 [Volvariella volvacea WC 439]|uniref:cellulase n=1 Tax=Volvariella volvacea TaxID=36659 RepID=Q9C3Z8_9AGAR|nr:endoglucanase [Volvariella volvacea]KAF8656235.1 hypothetical protein AX16_002671 [Volvariella volvacea WC 439]